MGDISTRFNFLEKVYRFLPVFVAKEGFRFDLLLVESEKVSGLSFLYSLIEKYKYFFLIKYTS